VPYYRNIFDERGLKPDAIQNFDDLKQLPFLRKSDFENSFEDMMAVNIPKSNVEYVTTGGTTGIPMAFYQEAVNNRIEWAFILNQWSRVDFKIGDKRAVLRCDIIKTSEREKHYEYDPLYHAMKFSSYHMTDENLHTFVEKIHKFRPDFLHVIPSTVTVLANYMRENNVRPFESLKAVLVGGENIFPWQYTLWEDAFQRRIFSWYGHSEMAVLAGECEVSKRYHLFPQYGFTEIIDHNGNRITKDGQEGEIVATGFLNHAMPFIRYRTGDRGVYSSAGCSCGRHYPMMEKVSGRIQEYIVRKDRKLISVTAALFSLHGPYMMNIKQIQLVQEKPGELIIQIVKNNLISEKEIERYILDEFTLRFGPSFKLKVKFVDHIEKTKRGKVKYLVQKIPIDFHFSRVCDIPTEAV
jgi:phenylacetate-CoA ligase